MSEVDKQCHLRRRRQRRRRNGEAAKAEYQASEPEPRGSRRSSRGTRWVVWTIREPLHLKIAENSEGELMRKSYSRFSEAVTAAQELGRNYAVGLLGITASILVVLELAVPTTLTRHRFHGCSGRRLW